MYSIGQVSEISWSPLSTLRCIYDKEGLFPKFGAIGSTRRFSRRRILNCSASHCLKQHASKSGTLLFA